MSKQEPFCSDRLGFGILAKELVSGTDLKKLQSQLASKASDRVADAGILMDLSVIAQFLGEAERGLALQHDVLGRQRLFRCKGQSRGIRLLAFAAEMDIGGNIPIELLLEGGDIELITLFVVPGQEHALPSCDAAIVIAPADSPAGTLEEIEHLTEGYTILNRPACIRQLDRDQLWRVLEGAPGLDIPQTARLSRDELVALARQEERLSELFRGRNYPFIIRPMGSHGGHGLKRIDFGQEIIDYLETQDAGAYFLSSYVDYASADGLFRKYRVVFVAGKPYPCHMAIADQWGIWYRNAEMQLNGEKRAEEARFFETFDSDFANRHAGALKELVQRISLDYFQIDCAETREGNLLLFEADIAAIVHAFDPPEIFPYKGPQIQKIFEAFGAMIHANSTAFAGVPVR